MVAQVGRGRRPEDQARLVVDRHPRRMLVQLPVDRVPFGIDGHGLVGVHLGLPARAWTAATR
jgi:hypothetical protein